MEALTRLLLLALLAFPAAVSAHRLDEYLQATLVAIEPAEVRLQINLTPGVAVADQVLALIDHDRDGVISTKEEAAYAELLKRDLIVRLDQRNVDLKLTASSFPTPTELRAGEGVVQFDFSTTAGSVTAGAHHLAIENRHLPTVSVYLVNAALPKSRAVQVTGQKRNANQSLGEIEFTVAEVTATAATRPSDSDVQNRLLCVTLLTHKSPWYPALGEGSFAPARRWLDPGILLYGRISALPGCLWTLSPSLTTWSVC